MARILAADIGGTNCRFALFCLNSDESAGPLLHLERQQWLPTADYPSFSDALDALRSPSPEGEPPLLPQEESPPDIAVIAAAGPVQGDVCPISNLNWIVKGQRVRERTGIAHVHLINDFVAQAWACLEPENVDAVNVLPGTPLEGAPVAVIGAGTGLGKALLLMPDAEKNAPGGSRNGRNCPDRPPHALCRARVLASEGGHAEFPFIGPEERDFADFAAERQGTRRLIGDHVVSGTGLAHLFAFHTGQSLPPPEATFQAPSYPAVLEWFARFYARAARNFVLEGLAMGGLFITGGMALRLPVVSHPAFAAELGESAIQRPLLEALPVCHIRMPHAGLWGAALYGLLQLEKSGKR